MDLEPQQELSEEFQTLRFRVRGCVIGFGSVDFVETWSPKNPKDVQ